MKDMNMSIVYLFYKGFLIILEIMGALISHNWSKAAEKTHWGNFPW